MKIAISTFQFAHNYGAMLQAFALKNFLEKNGHCVTFVPFYQEWARNVYTTNPFINGISLKKRLKLILQYKGRYYQSKLFEDFKQIELGCLAEFKEEKNIPIFLKSFDLLICGSDQIWNDRITGDIKAYYGQDSDIPKISYAASLGTKKLTDIQIRNAIHILPNFKFISVREDSSKKMLQEYIEHIEVVVDPVFLLQKKEWEEKHVDIEISSPYMLVYLLQEDENLLKFAREYAKNNSLKMIEVHPTTAVYHDGCIKFKKAGPREFLSLIANAECVCTNSFHATSFAIIYNKKLIHIPNIISPDRTVSLLNRIGVNIDKNGENPIYEFNANNYSLLDTEVEKSKKWLLSAIGGSKHEYCSVNNNR